MKNVFRNKSTFDRRPIIRLFEKNWDYYYEHRSELLRLYRNLYVAIWNEQVVDSDKDRLSLLRRVRATVGYKPVFVTKVTEHLRVVRVPSFALFHRRKTKE